MARKVEEWIGKTNDTPIPQGVKDRLLLKYNNRCAKTGHLFAAETPQWDHIIPLWKWRPETHGEPHGNRENNLQPLWVPAHKVKTAEEAKERAKINRQRAKHYGLKEPKKHFQSQPLGQGNNQHRATGKITKALPPRQSIYRS